MVVRICLHHAVVVPAPLGTAHFGRPRGPGRKPYLDCPSLAFKKPSVWGDAPDRTIFKPGDERNPALRGLNPYRLVNRRIKLRGCYFLQFTPHKADNAQCLAVLRGQGEFLLAVAVDVGHRRKAQFA